MNKMMQQAGPFVGWSLAWLMATGLALVLLAGRTGAAPADDAPEWKTLEAEILPVYKERKELNARVSKVRGIMNGSIPYGGNEAALDEFFLKFLFPSWTLTDEEHLGTLAKDRDRFITVDLPKSAGPVHDRLVEITFTKMQQIAQDAEFHPGVRYNAVLVLGALNTRDVDRVNKANPEPLVKALPVLEALYQKADETDAVRVAALLGILRHLEWDDYRVGTPKLDAAHKANLVQQLLALAQMTQPPAGRSLEGHTWMRRRALEGLMFVSNPAPSLEIAAAIEKLIADDAEPLSLRCAAADIMGRLNYQTPVVPASELNGKNLGHLALVACQSELTRLEGHEKLAGLRTRMPSQYGSGAMAGGGMAGSMMGKMMGGMTGGAAGGPGLAGGKGMTTMPGVAGGPGAGGMDPASMMQGMMGGKGKKNKSTKPKAKAAPDMMGMGGLTPPKADDQNYRMEYIRRRLRSWLYAVQMGLGDERANPENEVIKSGTGKNVKYEGKYTRGVAAYAQSQVEKDSLKEIIGKVQDLVIVVETPDKTYETFVEDLGAKMKELEQIVGPLKVEEPAKDDAAPAAAAGKLDIPTEEVPAAKGAAPPVVPAATPAATPAAPAEAGTAPAATKGAAPAPAGAKSP